VHDHACATSRTQKLIAESIAKVSEFANDANDAPAARDRSNGGGGRANGPSFVCFVVYGDNHTGGGAQTDSGEQGPADCAHHGGGSLSRVGYRPAGCAFDDVGAGAGASDALALALVRRMCHRQGQAVYQMVDFTLPFLHRAAAAMFAPKMTAKEVKKKGSYT
jgi:hypothetical protein